jgi:hypothetical protein
MHFERNEQWQKPTRGHSQEHFAFKIAERIISSDHPH